MQSSPAMVIIAPLCSYTSKGVPAWRGRVSRSWSTRAVDLPEEMQTILRR